MKGQLDYLPIYDVYEDTGALTGCNIKLLNEKKS